MKNSNFWLTTILILIAIIFRIIPHPFNFTPLIAVSLFAGSKFNRRSLSFIIPISAMLISDVVLSYINHYTFFHNTLFFVYGTILIIILLGWKLNIDKLNIPRLAIFTMVSSVLFFITTNFGTWLLGNLYTMDLKGLTTCFIMAIPFFKYSLLGDFFFVSVLFGVYEFIQIRYPNLKLQSKTIQNI